MVTNENFHPHNTVNQESFLRSSSLERSTSHIHADKHTLTQLSMLEYKKKKKSVLKKLSLSVHGPNDQHWLNIVSAARSALV